MKAKKSCPYVKLDTSSSFDKIGMLRNIIKKNNWTETTKDPDIIWKTREINEKDITRLNKSKALINRYPNPGQYTNKKEFSLIFQSIQQYFPEDLKFYPEVYFYPEDKKRLEEVLEKNNKNKKKTFILKPSEGSEGIGIQLFQAKYELLKESFSINQEFIIQKYVKDPLLIDNKKFDIRAYVLILGVNPIEAFISTEGLARFCTEEYKAPNRDNMRNVLSHLTNYSLNKVSNKFTSSQDILSQNNDSKRTLTSLYKSLEELGIDSKMIEEEMKKLAAKTIIALEPFITQEYYSVFGNKQSNKCFHIFGFDILFDKKCKPWLLEINAFPSLKIDNEKESGISPVDEFVKTLVIENAMKIAVLRKHGKKVDSYDNYERILPGESFVKYEMLKRVGELFTKLQGLKICGTINQSKFMQIEKLISGSVSKLERYDYNLIFIKVMKLRKEMNLIMFIRALEVLAERIFKEDRSRAEKFLNLIDIIH